MIGNDIVYLKQASKDSNWQRPRFLNKVFTDAEQEIILNSKNQNQMVWQLWSMKEAAYKVYVQQFGKRFFNPKRLVCAVYSKTKGMVTIDDVTYKTTSILEREYIHTIANVFNLKTLSITSFKTEMPLYHLQSKQCKQKILKDYSAFKAYTLTALSIQKNKLGVPCLFKNGLKQKEVFSLSHHGHYCAYIIS